MTESCIPILQVEDDPVDIRALRRVCAKLDPSVSITVANDGCEALDILKKPREGGGPPPPYLIFLDLNMPRMNGFEFLECLKEDGSLDENMVCILTSAEFDPVRIENYGEHVDEYLVKSEVDEDRSRLESVVSRFLGKIDQSVERSDASK